MTTKVRKSKWVEEPFKSMYISYSHRLPASFFGAVARLDKKYIYEKELVEQMMIWSFVEKNYSIPLSKDYSGSQAPYIRIISLYNCYREHCRKYRVQPCSFNLFRDEIKKHLELCFTKKGGQHAVYLVNPHHPAFQNSRTSHKYDFDIFSSVSILDIWQLFGKKTHNEKYAKTVDIKYCIRGGLDICLRKNFTLVKKEGI